MQGLISRNTGGSGTSVFYLFDHLGNVAQRLNASGQVLSSHRYTAYGSTTDANPDPFGYKGQYGYYTDSETGLILCGHRYYDPSAGRWLNRDPIGMAGGVNVYAYCGNDPVNGVDPSGLQFGIGGGSSSIPEFNNPTIGCPDPDKEIEEMEGLTATVFEGGGEAPPGMPGEGASAGENGSGGGAIPGGGGGGEGSRSGGGASEGVTGGSAGGAASSGGGGIGSGPSGTGLAGLGGGPSFIVSPGGDVIIVPSGASGPAPANNGRGIVFDGGSGGYGLDSRANGVRVMDPARSYPDGYVSYWNNQANGGQQTIDPYTGVAVHQSNPSWHIPLSPP